MKKIFALIFMACFVSFTYAQQWGTDGNKIFNLNSDNVLVGTGTTYSQTNPTISLGKFHVKAPTNASIFAESSQAGGINGAYAQFRLMSNATGGANPNGHMFNNVIRYWTATSSYEMLQSLYDPAGNGGAGKWCEFLYFKFADHKFEFRNGITDAEFQNAGKIYFNNNSGGTFGTTSGAVGIGVTAIASGVKLQVGGNAYVDGKIKCKEVEVALTTWPDVVFKPGYNLLPLNEVESFINVNKHLPGVPSEEEVVKNGVNVGDMNATLLQKIEELTLYMIDLKKENDALKSRVNTLETK